jgi:hypothetical protein
MNGCWEGLKVQIVWRRELSGVYGLSGVYLSFSVGNKGLSEVFIRGES